MPTETQLHKAVFGSLDPSIPKIAHSVRRSRQSQGSIRGNWGRSSVKILLRRKNLIRRSLSTGHVSEPIRNGLQTITKGMRVCLTISLSRCLRRKPQSHSERCLGTTYLSPPKWRPLAKTFTMNANLLAKWETMFSGDHSSIDAECDLYGLVTAWRGLVCQFCQQLGQWQWYGKSIHLLQSVLLLVWISCWCWIWQRNDELCHGQP
jgi:hypothetical protein